MLKALINSLKQEIKNLYGRNDDLQKDMERLRFEQSEVYRLFTENDNKIVEDYIKNKEKMDEEIAHFKTQIGVFDNDIANFKNTIEQHDLTVQDNKTRITRLSNDQTATKQSMMQLASNTARQSSLLETIDKTRVMCDQFNRAAEDLRNQLDTTDMYIENYLPFRTMKEIGTLLQECFDEKIANRIKIFEAKRIQQLYARMLVQEHKVPDFKSRLTRMRKEKAERIPGFGVLNRKGQKQEKLKLPIPDLQEWFDENKLEMSPEYEGEVEGEQLSKREIMKVSFDVDTERIKSVERQQAQFRRIMDQRDDEDAGVSLGQKTASEKYQIKEVTAEDLVVENEYGVRAPVSFLPVSEMPNKQIFGEIDPLEGSPAREMTKKMLQGELPIGEVARQKLAEMSGQESSGLNVQSKEQQDDISQILTPKTP